MHWRRILTALCAAPALVYILGPAPPWLFQILLCLVAVWGAVEFFRIAVPELPALLRAILCALLLCLFAVLYQRQILLAMAVVAAWAMVPMIWFMLAHRPPRPEAVTCLAKASLGMVYVGLPLAMLFHLHGYYPRGNLWILFLLAVVFAGDTGAFYLGRLFGTHKLHPAVSPGKTWEGAAGGFVASLLAGIFFVRIFPLHRLTPGLVLAISLMAAAAQVGDLCESMVKRAFGIKDSGSILPGHGGLLDRIDGLLFAVPVQFIYLLGAGV